MLRFLILICIIFSIIVSNFIYAREYNGGTVDLLLNGGYTVFHIQHSQYTGYDASMKLLFPFTGSKRFYFGIGVKYDNVSYTAPSNIQVSFTHAYDSLQAGPDLAYKLSFEYIDFLFNPYLYYSFYDTWLQTTTTPAYQQTYSPYLIHNLNYGIGLSALFKYIMSSSSLVSGFYFGPNAYYSQGYIIYRSTTDSKGNRFYGGEGSYYFYSINFTIGMFF